MTDSSSAIVAAVIYGFLMLFVAAHLIGRWQWRKRKLTRFSPHIVGDRSFKCKRMRQRLDGDFAFIAAISPDPRLVNPGLHPSAFGGKDGSAPPCHWYRMKTFDAAADFVSTHRGPGENNTTVPLDQFLLSLGGNQSWTPEQQSSLKCCRELYCFARHQAGAFGKDEFEEFCALIHQIKQWISSEVPVQQQSIGRSISNQVMLEPGELLDLASVRSLHTPLTPKSSQEPLLMWRKADDPNNKATPSSSSPFTVTRKPSSADKAVTELSPLVLDTDSQAFRRSSSPLAMPSPSSLVSTNI